MLRRVSIALCLLGLWSGVAHHLSLSLFAQSAGPAPPLRQPNAGANSSDAFPITGTYRTEHHAIVGQIVRDISDLAGYARSGRNQPRPTLGERSTVSPLPSQDLSRPRFSVNWKEGFPQPSKLELTLNGFIWDVPSFVPVARTLTEACRLTAEPASYGREEGDVLTNLLDFRAHIITQESVRVEKLLNRWPKDPGLHEDAALLNAAFCLKQPYNERLFLNRAVAHLAMAAALRGNQTAEFGRVGRLASLTIAVVSGRMTESQALINAWRTRENLTDVELNWLTALEVYGTGDWRLKKHHRSSSMLVRSVYVRALSASLTPRHVHDFIRKSGGVKSPEWSRAMLSTDADAQTAALFREYGWEAEKLEALLVYEALTGKRPDWKRPEDMLIFLNRVPRSLLEIKPDQTAELRILDAGALARYHQRHLVTHIRRSYQSLLKDKSAQAANDYRDSLQGFLRALSLAWLPGFAELDAPTTSATKPPDASESQMVRRRLLRELEQFPVRDLAAWVRWSGRHNESAQALSTLRSWTSNGVLPGTALDWKHYQVAAQSADPMLRQKLIDLWLELNPQDRGLVLSRAAGLADAAAFRSLAGPLLEYDLPLMRQYAQRVRNQPELYEEVMRRIGPLQPDEWFTLGAYFIAREELQKGASYFKAGWENAANRELAAQAGRWLALYYASLGGKKQAMDLAAKVAAEGGALGLETQILVHERTGDFEAAARFAREYAEKYQNDAPLVALYARHRQRGPKFEMLFKAVSRRLFPDGVLPVDLQALRKSKSPVGGVEVAKENRNTQRVGLQKGDVIVAVNDVLVRNQAQYLAARDFDPRPAMRLVIWNPETQKYVERSVTVTDKKFGVPLVDWQP